MFVFPRQMVSEGHLSWKLGATQGLDGESFTTTDELTKKLSEQEMSQWKEQSSCGHDPDLHAFSYYHPIPSSTQWNSLFCKSRPGKKLSFPKYMIIPVPIHMNNSSCNVDPQPWISLFPQNCVNSVWCETKQGQYHFSSTLHRYQKRHNIWGTVDTSPPHLLAIPSVEQLPCVCKNKTKQNITTKLKLSESICFRSVVS